MKLGIDLGTYNSAAAYLLPDQDEIVQVVSRSGANPSGKQFSSFVKFDGNGEVEFVGEPARNALHNNPDTVVWGAKRLVGRTYAEAQEKRELRKFAYLIESGPDGTIVMPQGPKVYTPEDILRIILERIKEDAENPRLNPLLAGMLAGRPIDDAVITVPAYYDAFRYGGYIKSAAKDAGFRKVTTIPEPVAAATRYGLKLDGSERMLAIDLGAGTLDVTVLRATTNGGRWFAEDTITSGNPEFGGIDIDELLFEHITAGLVVDAGALAQAALLRTNVERAKIELKDFTETGVQVPGGRTVRLTRDEVKQILTPALEKECDGALRVALHPEDQPPLGPLVDRVLLIGGPTKMHCIREYLVDRLTEHGVREDVLNRISLDPNAAGDVDPMNCVSEGAAAIASMAGTATFDPSAADSRDSGSSVVGKSVIVHEAYGYGTLLGPGQYAEIIPPNSACPNEGHRDITLERFSDRYFSAALNSRVPNTNTQAADAPPYRWTYLGDFGFVVVPDGGDLIVRMHIDLAGDRSATVTLQRMYPAGVGGVTDVAPRTGRRGERRKYYGLEHNKRHEITPLREYVPPPPPPPPPPPIPNPLTPDPSTPPAPRPAPLTPDQIRAITWAVRTTLDTLVPESIRTQARVAPEYESVEQALVQLGRKPDMHDATNLLNSTATLLSKLKNLQLLGSDEADRATEELDSLIGA